MKEETKIFSFDFKPGSAFYSDPAFIGAVAFSKKGGLIERFAGITSEYSGSIPAGLNEIIKKRDDYLATLSDFFDFFKNYQDDTMIIAHDSLKTRILTDLQLYKFISKVPNDNFINLMTMLHGLGEEEEDINDYIKKYNLVGLDSEEAKINPVSRAMNNILVFEDIKLRWKK